MVFFDNREGLTAVLNIAEHMGFHNKLQSGAPPDRDWETPS